MNLYAIRFREQGVVQSAYYGSAKEVLPVVQETYYRSTQSVPGVVQSAYTQETVIQQTDKQEDTYAQSANAIAPHTPAQKDEEDGRDDTNNSSAVDALQQAVKRQS